MFESKEFGESMPQPSSLQKAMGSVIGGIGSVVGGVAGFLGSHLADTFLKEGHEVIGCDNLIGGYLDNVPSDVEFHQYDCNY